MVDQQPHYAQRRRPPGQADRIEHEDKNRQALVVRSDHRRSTQRKVALAPLIRTPDFSIPLAVPSLDQNLGNHTSFPTSKEIENDRYPSTPCATCIVMFFVLTRRLHGLRTPGGSSRGVVDRRTNIEDYLLTRAGRASSMDN